MSSQTHTIKPIIFEATMGYYRIKAGSFEEAYMMEKSWNSLNFISMEPEDFNNVLQMLESEDTESQMLATKILLNSAIYDSGYPFISNPTKQGLILSTLTDIHSNLADSIAKIVENEIQPSISLSEKAR